MPTFRDATLLAGVVAVVSGCGGRDARDSGASSSGGSAASSGGGHAAGGSGGAGGIPGLGGMLAGAGGTLVGAGGVIGGCSPEDRANACTGRECGRDPVCGVLCGTCPGPTDVCQNGRCFADCTNTQTD